MLPIILSLFVSFHLQAKSVTQMTSYPQWCLQAAQDQSIFQHFRRADPCRWIVETVDYEQGITYADAILKEYPYFIPAFPQIVEEDRLGEPVTWNFPPIGTLSPTTLRYVKTAGDLQKEFGDLKNFRIVEIGGGFGGQCKILRDLCPFKSYTIVDLPECTPLIAKYLSQNHVENAFCLDSTAIDTENSYDLVISNYALSEIDKSEQMNYLKNIVNCSLRGYLTYNDVSSFNEISSLTKDEVISFLTQENRKIKISPENPPTGKGTFVITWEPTP